MIRNLVRREGSPAMTTKLHCTTVVGLSWALVVSCWARPSFAAIEFETEIVSLDLNGRNIILPLAPNWAPILTDIHIGESASLQSLGRAIATPTGNPDEYFVQSFFDVFFDITITDVDPASNFGGGLGSSLSFSNSGPYNLQANYLVVANPNAPNLGLFPPLESFPFIGGFFVEELLGADVNGNGEDDKIKTDSMSLALLDQNRTFIVLPDGTVINNTDASLVWNGAVVDESQDPPFSADLLGPISVTSREVSPQVPEPAAIIVWIGLACLVGWPCVHLKREETQNVRFLPPR
jgi:hypothetical protein